MIFKVRFAPEAEDTYASIVAQLKRRWGEKVVIALEEKISNALSNISSDPYIYPAAGNNVSIRKCVLHKNCSMIYTIKSDYIYIICFWDNRQEPLIF